MKADRHQHKWLLLAGVLLLLDSRAVFAATTNVSFGSFFFAPKSVTINVGDTVIWTNASFAFHTVTGTGADPVCGPGSVPVSCSHTFTQPGTFPYVCTVFGHAAAGMTGVVIVVQAPITPATLSSPMRLPDGPFAFTVTTSANRTNVVETSTNFSNWIAIGTNVPTSNSFNFTDTNGGSFSRRFYRVSQP